MQSEEHVAIYHLSVKLITRGAGRSATAAIAYRAAERVPDERTGLVFDYSRKRGVEHTEVVLPSAVAEAAGWARDRVRLWNAAEAAENRKDSRVAREYEVALPRELKAAERLQLVRDFAREIAERHGCAIDFAIHAPHRDGDVRNHHAHVLATTRCVGRDGLGAKTDIELKDTDRAKRGLCSGRAGGHDDSRTLGRAGQRAPRRTRSRRTCRSPLARRAGRSPRAHDPQGPRGHCHRATPGTLVRRRTHARGSDRAAACRGRTRPPRA